MLCKVNRSSAVDRDRVTIDRFLSKICVSHKLRNVSCWICGTTRSCFSDDYYNENARDVPKSKMNDGPATVVVTMLVLILWLFSIYRLYRVWSVKLNFSGVSENVRYCFSYIDTCQDTRKQSGLGFPLQLDA